MIFRIFTTGLLFVFAFFSQFAQANLVRDQLTANKEVPLPIKSLLQVADQIEIKFHTDNDVAMASFSKGNLLQSNKLFLYEPYYNVKGSLIKPVNMAVDVSEHYFSSLIEAYFILITEKSGSTYQAFYLNRAKALMTDVPAKFQVEAYRSAVAGFVGSLFSISIAIEKTYLRNGQKICPVFSKPNTLFTLWQNNFSDMAAFPGEWYENNDWKFSKKRLQKIDKDEILKSVLESFWTGDASIDFQKRFCPNE